MKLLGIRFSLRTILANAGSFLRQSPKAPRKKAPKVTFSQQKKVPKITFVKAQLQSNDERREKKNSLYILSPIYLFFNQETLKNPMKQFRCKKTQQLILKQSLIISILEDFHSHKKSTVRTQSWPKKKRPKNHKYELFFFLKEKKTQILLEKSLEQITKTTL